jgi:hypothetical protein
VFVDMSMVAVSAVFCVPRRHGRRRRAFTGAELERLQLCPEINPDELIRFFT